MTGTPTNVTASHGTSPYPWINSDFGETPLEWHLFPNTTARLAGQARCYTSPPTTESMGKHLSQKPVSTCRALQGAGGCRGGRQRNAAEQFIKIHSLWKVKRSGRKS